jgi:type II secretory pathway predicted ATPase ExeA
MYQDFYGLRELPFELTPNPHFLYMAPHFREALSAVEYGLFAAKAVTVLLGDPGTGKTTLVQAALASERCRHVRVAHIKNPSLTRGEFLEVLTERFGLSRQAGESKTRLLEELEPMLRGERQKGTVMSLLIDEAQGLSDELLEEVRLLANTETDTEKLLPIVLAGQSELGHRLNEPQLWPLKQRVTIRAHLRPFTVQETAAYVAQRIQVAGGDASKLFTREAVVLVHELSAGLPRTINVICDNALLTGCGLGRQPVNRAMVLDVAADLDLRAAAPSSESGRQEPQPAAHSEPASNDPAAEGATGSAAASSVGKPPFSVFSGLR